MKVWKDFGLGRRKREWKWKWWERVKEVWEEVELFERTVLSSCVKYDYFGSYCGAAYAHLMVLIYGPWN